MTSYQWSAIAVTVLLSALDGYNVLSVSLAAPGILKDWHINRASLGIVLSSSLAGMAMGSLLVAPFADVVGRRHIVIASLLLMIAGSLLSAFSSGIDLLIISRLITGLGIGAMVAVINPLAAEHANGVRREFAVALMTIGFPIGGVVGGWGVGVLLRWYSWHSIFGLGAILGFCALPFAFWSIHEPPGFLVGARRVGSLEAINRTLSKYGQPPLNRLPQPNEADTGKRPYDIFSADQIRTTILVAAANLLFVMTVYFILYWAPQAVVDLGFSAAEAAAVSATMNFSGILGGALFGWLARSLGLRRITFVALLGLGATSYAFGLLPPALALVHLCAVAIGLFLFSGMVGLYATISRSFPSYCRATGSGFVIGIGRIGSAIAPALAGLLFTLGLPRPVVFATMAASAVLAAFVYLFVQWPALKEPELLEASEV
jgi:MFS family permease